MRFRAPIAAALAISFGLVVLLGYFIPAELGGQTLAELRIWIIGGASILAAFATLVAIISLVGTHWHKLRARRNPDRYSFFMLAAFAVVFVFGVSQYLSGDVTDFNRVVSAIQVPVEASLMAVLAITLTLAAMRLFRRRIGLLPIVFFLSVLAFLLLNSGILASLENVPLIGDLLAVLQFLPVAGARGLLIGIALGSIMAGLRVLFGADRPYSG